MQILLQCHTWECWGTGNMYLCFSCIGLQTRYVQLAFMFMLLCCGSWRRVTFQTNLLL